MFFLSRCLFFPRTRSLFVANSCFCRDVDKHIHTNISTYQNIHLPTYPPTHISNYRRIRLRTYPAPEVQHIQVAFWALMKAVGLEAPKLNPMLLSSAGLFKRGSSNGAAKVDSLVFNALLNLQMCWNIRESVYAGNRICWNLDMLESSIMELRCVGTDVLKPWDPLNKYKNLPPPPEIDCPAK